jgi:hypothetical protein
MGGRVGAHRPAGAPVGRLSVPLSGVVTTGRHAIDVSGWPKADRPMPRVLSVPGSSGHEQSAANLLRVAGFGSAVRCGL